MSVKMMGLVWDLDLEPNRKFVLLAYADHADHKGKNIFPAIQTIANKTNYHERSVQRITRELEDTGYLLPDGLGPNGTNKWALPLTEGGDKIAPVAKCQGDTDSGDIPSGDKLPPESFNRHLEEEEEEEAIDFGQVWSFYQNNFHMGGTYDHQKLGDLFDEHGGYWTIQAMQLAIENGKRNIAYFKAILDRWKAEGYGTTQKTNGKGHKPANDGLTPLDRYHMKQLELEAESA